MGFWRVDGQGLQSESGHVCSPCTGSLGMNIDCGMVVLRDMDEEAQLE